MIQQTKKNAPFRTLSPRARITAFLGAAIFTLGLMEFEPALRARVQHPLQFELRSKLGRDPKVDERIKIYAFGDSSVAYLGREELSLTEWARIFHLLDAAHPRAILIDRMFSQRPATNELEQFKKQMKGIKASIISGAFVSPTPISYKATLDQKDLTPLADLKYSLDSGFFYGPHPDLRDVFQKVGHFDFSRSPYLNLLFQGAPGLFLPSAPLFTAHTLEARDAQIQTDGHTIPTDSQGRTLLNFIHPRNVQSSIFSFTNLLKRIEDHESVELKPDSVVVLLTSFHTANSQMVDSPYGLIPSAYINVAAVNSVLSGQWIHSFPWAKTLLFSLAAVGFLSGLFLQGLAFYVLTFFATLLVVGGGLYAFGVQSWDTPWLAGAASFASTALTSFLISVYARSKQLRKLTDAFEGTLPPALLKSLIEKPSIDWLEPKNKVVSIMFIDVVGFSVMAETLGPAEVFTKLKALLAGLTDTVHRFGGTIDKSIGDGLMCFFGLEENDLLGRPESAENHAERALTCAAEIQKLNAEQCLEAKKNNLPVLPLRIGINTAAVVIGNLGNQHRIDLTLIGRGVNMAQRMESAAEPFLIMMGPGTSALISDAKRLGVKVTRRWAAVKHFSDLVEAYEVNPFLNEPALYKDALAAYRETCGKVRAHERYSLESNTISVTVPSVGSGSIVDVSQSGIGVVLPRYLGRGVMLEVSISSKDAKLEKKLREQGITPLLCEVKWGVEMQKDKYFSGLSIKNLSEAKSKVLVQLLRPYRQKSTRGLKKKAA